MDLSDNKKWGMVYMMSIDNMVMIVDVKIATSILTGKIQPLEEITVAKSKGSLRAQIIAEEEIRFGEEIEAEEV